MSFPVNIHGNYGDEKKSQSTKIGSLPLGTRMILPDGRIFAHSRASTAAGLNPGYVCVGAAVSSSAHVANLTASASTGSQTIAVTLTATGAVTADQFADGWIFCNDSGAATGEGYVYKVKGNNSGAVSTTVNFFLDDNDSVKVALAAASSEVGIKVNEFDHVLHRAAGTGAVNMVSGVAPVAVSAGYYHWHQRRGPVAVLSGGTPGIVGMFVAAATTVAGVQAHNPIPANTTVAPVAQALGWVISPSGASADYDLIYLTLD